MAAAMLNMSSATSNSLFVPGSLARNAAFRSSRTMQLDRTAHAAMKTNTGFGKPPEYKAKPKILKELGKVENKETYTIFVRKVKFPQQEPLTKWEKLGEMVIEAGKNVQVAIIERKNNLAVGVKHQYPVLLILEKDEALQYGFCLRQETKEAAKDKETAKEGDETSPEIIAIDSTAKQSDETVAAILRVEDGRTPGVAPPRSQRM